MQKKSSKAPASARHQKTEKFVADYGLKLMDSKDIPDDGSDKASNVFTQKNAQRASDATEIAIELLSIAKAADPGVAVAAVLLSYALLPNMSSMAIQGTGILVEKYENRTKNVHQKDVVLHGLEIVTSALAPANYREPLAKLKQTAMQNPNEDPEHLERIDQLKGKSDNEKASVPLFRDNGSTILHIETPQKSSNPVLPVQHTLPLFHDLKKGPKPPTDEIFYERTQSDN